MPKALKTNNRNERPRASEDRFYIPLTTSLKNAARSVLRCAEEVRFKTEGTITDSFSLAASFLVLRFEGKEDAETFSRSICAFGVKINEAFPKSSIHWPGDVARERLQCGPEGNPRLVSPSVEYCRETNTSSTKASLQRCVEQQGDSVALAPAYFCPTAFIGFAEDICSTRRFDMPVQCEAKDASHAFVAAFSCSVPVRVRAYNLVMADRTADASSFEMNTNELYDLHESLLRLLAMVAAESHPSRPHHVKLSAADGNNVTVQVDGVEVVLTHRSLRALLALALLSQKGVFLASEFSRLYSGQDTSKDTKASKDTFGRPVKELKNFIPRIQVDENLRFKRLGQRRVWGLNFIEMPPPEMLRAALERLRRAPR